MQVILTSTSGNHTLCGFVISSATNSWIGSIIPFPTAQVNLSLLKQQSRYDRGDPVIPFSHRSRLLQEWRVRNDWMKSRQRIAFLQATASADGMTVAVKLQAANLRVVKNTGGPGRPRNYSSLLPNSVVEKIVVVVILILLQESISTQQ